MENTASEIPCNSVIQDNKYLLRAYQVFSPSPSCTLDYTDFLYSVPYWVPSFNPLSSIVNFLLYIVFPY